MSFGGIQFNTALKQMSEFEKEFLGFGGIQFNTALKLQKEVERIELVLEAFNSTQL